MIWMSRATVEDMVAYYKREENKMAPISLAASEKATSPFPASSLTIQETLVTNKYLL
jgi:hypothetical protein